MRTPVGKNLEALRAFGCAIAIDDFGTGYANYERLKHLQADIIKIDGCFVRDISSRTPLDAIMVKSIVEMARAKQMSVVAECRKRTAKSALAGAGRELSAGLSDPVNHSLWVNDGQKKPGICPAPDDLTSVTEPAPQSGADNA